MSSHLTRTTPRTVRTQSGFTLVELMVTVAIALFLIGGLLTVLQNVRGAYNNQQALSQLQDQQRFALTVLTDVIQAGGYFPNPVLWTPALSLPAAGSPCPGAPAFVAGQAFDGCHPAVNGPDTITVRYRTLAGENVIFCDGSTNTATAPTGLFVNQFSVVAGQLQCQLTNAATGAVNTVPIVSGIQSLVVYYGVKRNPVPPDYNVDTYLTADLMNPAGPNGNDWLNVSSVRVVLTFTNPLCTPVCQPGQNATINFERVIEVMSRAGVHT
jgi:type IV pilus assembly protein PilW